MRPLTLVTRNDADLAGPRLVLSLALLAPDIVEAIPDGRQAAGRDAGHARIEAMPADILSSDLDHAFGG